MKYTGAELAQSLNTIIRKRKIATIKEVMRAAWDEQHKPDIPEFLKPKKERFEYHFNNIFLPSILNGFHFHETYNWAHGQLIMLKLIKANNILKLS